MLLRPFNGTDTPAHIAILHICASRSEDHNLVERKNRKDLSIRLGQFFDYYLKDAKPAKWIKDGLPATDKGKDWGLDVE